MEGDRIRKKRCAAKNVRHEENKKSREAETSTSLPCSFVPLCALLICWTKKRFRASRNTIYTMREFPLSEAPLRRDSRILHKTTVSAYWQEQSEFRLPACNL